MRGKENTRGGYQQRHVAVVVVEQEREQRMKKCGVWKGINGAAVCGPPYKAVTSFQSGQDRKTAGSIGPAPRPRPNTDLWREKQKQAPALWQAVLRRGWWKGQRRGEGRALTEGEYSR
jgi:hypothetical protein